MIKQTPIEKINLKDKNILAYEQIEKTEYYKPLNTNALKYIEKKYQKNKKDKLFTIENTIIDTDEKTIETYQTNLVEKLLKTIPIKDKGLKNIDNKILVYLKIDGKIEPLNENAEENKDKILNLITTPPTYCAEIWTKIDEKNKSYLDLI